MTHTILVLLVALFSALGLVLIALGLPGIWLIVLAVIGSGLIRFLISPTIRSGPNPGPIRCSHGGCAATVTVSPVNGVGTAR